MSKRDKEKAPRHVRLYHWFLKTEAWQSLSPNARALYVEIVTRYNGSNNGRIGFSARDAGKALHTSKDTGARSLVELQDRGFIVLTKRSGFSLKTKTATEWLLTEFCSDINGQFATKDFMRWSVARSAEKQNTVPVVIPSVPVVRQYGPCGETVAGTVPVVRLMSAKKTVPRSDYGDTYSIPGGAAPKGRKPTDSAAISDCAVPNDETTIDTVPHRELLVWLSPTIEEVFGDEAERLRASAVLNGIVVLDGGERVNGKHVNGNGHTPRAQWLAGTKSKGEQPWIAEGMSRRNWYRKQSTGAN
ncbi:MAG: hypothetical protein ACLQFW_15930 [Xanthobacteraceae bacterium]